MIDYTRYEYKDRYENMLSEIESMVAEKQNLDRLYMEHINSRSNDHNVTAKVLDLDKVKNIGIALESDKTVDGGAKSKRYATPLSHKRTIDFIFLNELKAHILNKDNPHNLTLEQIESISKMDIMELADLYYNRGEIVNFTYGLGGKSLPDLYTEIRSNLNASNLKTNKLKLINITAETDNTKTTVVLKRDETLTLKDLSNDLPSNNIYIVSTPYSMRGGTMPASSTIATWMNQNHPPSNLLEGTLGAIRLYSSFYDAVQYSNGGRYEWHANLTDVYILQVQNKRWVA